MSATWRVLRGLLLRRRLHPTDTTHPRYHVGITVCGAAPWARLRFRLAHAPWAAHALAGAAFQRGGAQAGEDAPRVRVLPVVRDVAQH